jgi:VIT1/CCC1 family predicted Fe2+/Mn2+ transporter
VNVIRKYGRQAIFGTTDGLVCVVGVMLSLAHTPGLIFRAALGVGVAEMIGMGLAQFLSESDEGFLPSLAMGLASGLGAIVPAIPYTVMRGAPAIILSLLLFLGLTTMVAVTRVHTRGWKRAFIETFLVMIVAATAVAVSQAFAPGGAG